MSRAILLILFACLFVGISTWAIAKYAYPEYAKLKGKALEQQAELREKELERDTAMVEEAEREYEERR